MHARAQEAELKELLKRKKHPVCYDGFEPSGRMHIAQGILKAINVRAAVFASCTRLLLLLCLARLTFAVPGMTVTGEQADRVRLRVQVLGRRLVCAAEQQGACGQALLALAAGVTAASWARWAAIWTRSAPSAAT